MKPSELGICQPSEDAAYMIGYAVTRKLMEAYEEEKLHDETRDVTTGVDQKIKGAKNGRANWARGHT